MHQAGIFLQYIVLNEHVPLKLVFIILVCDANILRRLGSRRRGGLVDHLLRVILRDKHDTVLAVVADDRVCGRLWLVIQSDHRVFEELGGRALELGLAFFRLVALARRVLLVELDLVLRGLR